MIGKLNVWRSEHRKDGHSDKMRVGGLVSIEELNGTKREKLVPPKSPKKVGSKTSPELPKLPDHRISLGQHG
jgi:hypothetical protein